MERGLGCGLGNMLMGKKGESKALDKGRQQRGRRHRALRTRTRLLGAERHYRQRRSIHSIRRLCDDFAERISVVEDCYAGDNGSGGCFTTGIANWRLQRRSRNTRALYDRSIDQKSRMHIGDSMAG
jgi:hypothetical protein